MRFSVAALIAFSAALVAAHENHSPAPEEPSVTATSTSSTTVVATVTSCAADAPHCSYASSASSHPTEVVPPVVSGTECAAPVTVTVTVTAPAVCEPPVGSSTGVPPPYPTDGGSTHTPIHPTGTGHMTNVIPSGTGSVGTGVPPATTSPIDFEGAGSKVQASFALGAVVAVAALVL